MERRGSDAAWFKYLHQAFAENRPWDQLAREILNPNANEGDAKAAAYFYIKRLDKVGQNLTDYPGVTRDVGRLFLGMDLQCAQCHNHLFIDDYKQADFQGLFVVYQNTFLRNDVKPTVIGENLLKEKVEFSSVFDKVKHTVGVRIPGVGEVPMPRFAAGEEYVQPPDKKTRFPGIPKFSPLAEVANRLPTAENRPFARNFVNRLWFMMMGRGLVQPLDQHHSANPPSHPAVLDLLTDEFIAHKFDIRWLLGELAKSETYQRASELPTTGQAPPADRFLMAAERRLSAEQLMYSVLTATETRVPEAGAKLDALESRFVKALANPPLEPEEEFAPSLQSALFLLHDSAVLECVSAKNDNVVKRLAEVKDNNQVVDEVYLAVLTRKPVDEERAAADKFLTAAADQRPDAIGQLVWALLASTEFMVNH
jgi:hypothetical protein